MFVCPSNRRASTGFLNFLDASASAIVRSCVHLYSVHAGMGVVQMQYAVHTILSMRNLAIERTEKLRSEYLKLE